MPVGVAFGLWSLVSSEISLALSVVAGVTIGIVVDDTIHFMNSYLRSVREHGLKPIDAMRYTFQHTGIAVVITSVVLIAGFLVLSSSHFKVNSELGLMTAITIFIALVIDLLFFPALLLKLDGSQVVKNKIQKEAYA
jgi:predicted RND superfamily exporter protein